MKVIIAGSRNFDSYEFLRQSCDSILHCYTNVEVVSGTAKGADKLGEYYAESREFAIKRFPANWNLHGKSAGYIRNTEMANYADMLICFWDGESLGTKHMIDIAKKNNLIIHLFKTDWL